MTRFDYPRFHFPLRLSVALDKEIAHCAESLGVTKTDVCIYAIAQMLDPTGKATPDVAMLPENLRADFRPRSVEQIMEHYF